MRAEGDPGAGGNAYRDDCALERNLDDRAATGRRRGVPITLYRFPEAVFGADDRNVRRVKAAAARAGRSWRGGGAAHRADLARLARVLEGTDTGRLRFWSGVVMLDGRYCGASGAGGYWAVAARLVNEQARAELRRRGDAWRAAGLGPIATLEAVREAGLDVGEGGPRGPGPRPSARNQGQAEGTARAGARGPVAGYHEAPLGSLSAT